MRLTPLQSEVLADVCDHPGLCTAQLRAIKSERVGFKHGGFSQYDSLLRDRLMKLVAAGLVIFREEKVGSVVKKRTWFPAVPYAWIKE